MTGRLGGGCREYLVRIRVHGEYKFKARGTLITYCLHCVYMLTFILYRVENSQCSPRPDILTNKSKIWQLSYLWKGRSLVRKQQDERDRRCLSAKCILWGRFPKFEGMSDSPENTYRPSELVPVSRIYVMQVREARKKTSEAKQFQFFFCSRKSLR